MAIDVFRHVAEHLEDVERPRVQGNTAILREPLGVVAAITPWNYPLFQAALKVAPAVGSGASVILKPSEEAPLSSQILKEVFDEAGAPGGVFEVVVGSGPTVGEQLVADPRIEMVSFTGSTVAGRRIATLAAAAPKRATLELGGKSPLVVLDGADLEGAVRYSLTRCFANAGQTCAALTRLIVSRSALGEVEERLLVTLADLVVGDPQDERTSLGPVFSARQRDRVLGMIRTAESAGVKLLAGGSSPLPEFERGYYVRPTVFSDVSIDQQIAHEEVFGPVLVVQAYEDEDEAVSIANSTPYGLGAGVWSSDPDRAMGIARQIRSGVVFLGDAPLDPHAPFGGVKHSGYGRERGVVGLEEYYTTKSVFGGGPVVAPSSNSAI